MNYFEQKLSSEIVRKVSAKLDGLEFRVLPKTDFSRQVDGIKDCVASGTNEIRILADNRFEIELSTVIFSRAVTKDYVDGLSRIRALSENFFVALNSDDCRAWQVVTLYYIGFFSAVEILRAFGEYVSYFGDDVIEVVKQSASMNAGRLETGTFLGVAKYDTSSGNVTIAYAKSNVRHHQHAWGSVASLVKTSCKPRGKDEAEVISRVVQALGLPARSGVHGISPSDTRNHWNYEDPKLFGNSGKVASAQLVKLMKSPGAALTWARSKSNLLDLGSATCALGFSSEFLKMVSGGLAERIIPD